MRNFKLIVNNTQKNNEKIFEGTAKEIFYKIQDEIDFESFREEEGQELFTIEDSECIERGWLEKNNTEKDYIYLLENYISDGNFYYQELIEE